jgi:hypothetical protein
MLPALSTTQTIVEFCDISIPTYVSMSAATVQPEQLRHVVSVNSYALSQSVQSPITKAGTLMGQLH